MDAPFRFLKVVAALGGLAVAVAAGGARAEVPVQRTFYRLASSNGYGAALLDLSQARVTHFREHLFATEEPKLDASGVEVWEDNQPAVVRSRDLLYDAYFGLRMAGNQQWLVGVPVDLDASGYAGWADSKKGGTGVATMVQKVGDLEATQYVFAPKGLAHAGFVMAMRLRNTGAAPATGVSAFSLHNFHLGFGRPGVLADIGEQGETIGFDGTGGKADFLERGFAGVVVARALGPVAHHGASNAASPPSQSVFAIVDGGGAVDLPDLVGEAPTADGSVSAYQFDLGDIPPGGMRWVGVAFAHDGDPFSGAAVQGWLDALVGGSDAEVMVEAELGQWSTFQQQLKVPPALSGDEDTLLRHSAAMLRMAQNQESQFFLREWLTTDGEPRKTRFGPTLGAPPATLPATVAHRGQGAVIASLPPGEWTYAWIRDGAYASTAMASLGMKDEARAALSFYLGAEAGRFQQWDELKAYGMPPYQISLVRYHGFGVEETDVNDFGPNLEFDGFGLFLWALASYETLTGDTSLADASWDVVSQKVADVLVALIDPETGLVRRDSSIWESHWKGRERFWTYTSITAARGLCDAAALAERIGDADRAKKYRDAGVALRASIAGKLTDPSHALASNMEELAAGEGYFDAAVLDGIALGLFDPAGPIAKATLAALDDKLAAPAGAGWSRNDDRFDHQGTTDLSPWGSEYDSAEWVVTDLRGAVATRRMGDTARADRLLAWVRDQSLANYLAVSETYDEGNGTYKFNAPMIGFGAGVYALALADRDANLGGPACGAYFDEGAGSGAGGAGGTSANGPGSGSGAAPSGAGPGSDDGGCGCRTAPTGGSSGWALALAGIAAAAGRRRRRDTGKPQRHRDHREGNEGLFSSSRFPLSELCELCVSVVSPFIACALLALVVGCSGPGGFNAVYPPRPPATPGAPMADPTPSRIVMHATVTSAALKTSLEEAFPPTGEGSFPLLRSERKFTWRRDPLAIRFDQGRIGVDLHVVVTLDMPVSQMEFPIDFRMLAEPVVTSEYIARLQSTEVTVSSTDRLLKLADIGAGVLDTIKKAVEKQIADFSYDLRPALFQAYQRVGTPIDIQVGDANACAELKLLGIEAGPTVLADGVEKDMALVVAPSVTMPCNAHPEEATIPPLANVATLQPGPFTVSVPIAARYEELAKAMTMTFTKGRLYFSKEYPKLYMEKPEVYASQDRLVLKLHITGPITKFGFDTTLDGDLYMAGHPVVEDNELRVPDLEPTIETQSFLLKLKAMLDGDSIRDQARAALRLDIGERLLAVKDKLSTNLSFGYGQGCLKATADKIEVTGVHAHGSYLRVYVSVTGRAAAYLPCQ